MMFIYQADPPSIIYLARQQQEGWTERANVRIVAIMLTVFCAYAEKDSEIAAELIQHLTLLKRQGLIDLSHSGSLKASDDKGKLLTWMDHANIVLALLSVDFFSFFKDELLEDLIQRNLSGKMDIIPIQIKAVDYSFSRLSAIQAFPKSGPPINLARDRDSLWADLICEIKLKISRPTPSYDNKHHTAIGAQLQKLYARRKDIVIQNQANQAPEVLARVEDEILETKRRLRQGPQLKAGDYLSDRFQLIEKLGQGGIAVVWKAWDEQKQNLVAVKVLHGQWAEDKNVISRFFRGARQMENLQHGNIVGIIESHGKDSGFFYFVMEYVNGVTIRHAVLSGRLTWKNGLHAIVQMCDALQYAHERGIVHRDVKPANILIDSEGDAFLTDFDLVLAENTTGGTRSNTAFGTYGYAAPESMRNAKYATRQADVYSLGMTAFFIVFGDDLGEHIIRNPEFFVKSLNCPQNIKSALSRAIAIEQEKRFRSVIDFRVALLSAANGRRARVLNPQGEIYINSHFIKNFRLDRRLTRKEMAYAIGVSTATYIQYETKNRLYSNRGTMRRALETLAQKFGLQLEDFLTTESEQATS